ncbi:TRM11 family SAM-dependent methyltransferase [Glycomyces paridis]|uniref:TRM11 family SAM-dependent methyltransferase n=1 Tax=Glycomyces paridis TaxID=2126555 RepID=UPI0013051493|nr:DNA methyltransferase [Glycomyces paridis]
MARSELSIWATGQVQPRRQRDGLYDQAGAVHPAKMWPRIAQSMIEHYSSPGEAVLDPMCGIGTVLIEAVRARRHALGVDCEAEWVDVARANLARARRTHPGTDGTVFCADARNLAATLADQPGGLPVDLVVTSPPYGPAVHGLPETARKTGGKIVRRAHRYATGKPHPGQLARGSSQKRLRTGLASIFGGCHTVLRRGGHMVITARPYTDKGELVDFPAVVIAAAEDAGFAYTDRHAALLARWDEADQTLYPHVTLFHLGNVRRQVEAGKLGIVRAHEDVLVFRKSR